MSKKKPIDLDQLSNQDIIKSFYLSQGFLFIIGCIGYFIFYYDMPSLTSWMTGNPLSILFLGIGSGMVLAFLELGMDRVVPESWLDDGGINKRVFKAFSRFHIIIAMLVVAIIEEGLFRGVIQTEFGWVIASLLFGFIHIRYLKKPLMLIVALGMGFYLGWLYILTNSLIVPIAAHYTIDVFLGFVLKRTTEKESIFFQ